MPLTDEQKQRIREEEIERMRVRRELSGVGANRIFIFWGALIAAAVLLWRVMTVPHNH
jgi:hypothetical protein